MRFQAITSLAGSLALLVLFSGCEPPPPPVYPVSGTVNLDGKPMAEGEVAFVSTEEGVRDTLPVRDGKFQGEIRAGQRKVEVAAYREERQGVEMYGDQAPISRVNYVDPQFNSQSKLVASVNTSSANEYTFDVKSRK
ncbi:MAG TPA: hypothetical protein VGN57_07835 [Pirellulaceae bacterium]|jgi:hypothetical protein|nr:hypothetical protein [Pirellulaceae bacterium]